MGWGYLGNRGDVRNPFSSVLGSKMDSRQNDVSLGGNFSTESWFRGDAAWFGGLEYQSPWKTVFKVEYDGNHYQREPQDNNQTQKSPINLGLVYRPTCFQGVGTATLNPCHQTCSQNTQHKLQRTSRAPSAQTCSRLNCPTWS